MNTHDKDQIMSAVISLLDMIVIMKSGKDVIPKIVLVVLLSAVTKDKLIRILLILLTIILDELSD
jgi:NAD-dependent DNA ligase